MNEKTAREIELESEIESLRQKRHAANKKVSDLENEIKAQQKLLRDEWNRKACEEIDALQAALSEEYGIDVKAERFQKIWQIAWDRGHSSGLTDVRYAFEEMADLLK